MNTVISIISALLQIIGIALFQFYGWVVVVAIFGFLIWQNRRREKWVSQTEHVLLQIEVPKENEKKELSAEQMFASLHGILRPKSDLIKEGAMQEHISFEIASLKNQIHFYVWTPRHLKDFVEGQIYAQYPNVRILEGVEDYAKAELGNRTAYTTELKLTKNDVMPIKTFQSFEVDPLAGITAVLAKLEEAGEEMWIQILARPVEDNWQDAGYKYIDDVKSGKAKGKAFENQVLSAFVGLFGHIILHFIGGLSAPPEAKKEEKKEDTKLSTGQQAIVKAVEEKSSKLGYQVKIRIAYAGNDSRLARMRIQSIVGGFKQFNTTNLNGFVTSHTQEGTEGIDEYRARLFLDNGYTLNIEELASIYHLPHKSVETPNMVWTSVKSSEPPANLPSEATSTQGDVSLFAATNFRGSQIKFGMKRFDRSRHLYIIGQTGTGKSKLLNLLTLSDIYHNQGIAIVDPHGDFATDMLQYIPEHRLKDVIYFNPTDRDNPIAFNPLEVSDPAFKNDISSEMVGVLKRMFDSWGPRLEYILRYTILALLDYPDSTMLGITRMLTDKEFRKKVIKEIQDPVVKAFWVTEFASWNDKFATEAVAPILNKVGAFVANPLIRNIIGQPKSGFDLRDVMDNGKILIVNLSRGQIGEDNASVLGALMVTKIQLAAMSRANMPIEQRRPFYLYVDEFQNFATDSFATILSEARKYALNLTVANQYVSQMPEEVRDAVFGNVGSMITFRIGANDSTVLGKYFAPTFEPDDLIKLNNQHIFINMSIDGEKALPFSAKTLRMPDPEHDITPDIVAWSREHYAAKRTEVEDEIAVWTLGQAAGATPGATEGETRSTAAQVAAAMPDEQKPNSFLGGLKNPTPPAVKSGNSSGGGGSNRDRDRDRRRGERNRNNDRNDRPRGGGGSQGGQGSRERNSSSGEGRREQPAAVGAPAISSPASASSERTLAAGEPIALRQPSQQ